MFWAGNFPMMKDIEFERDTCNRVIDKYPCYRRLGSYFFKEDLETLFQIKREVDFGQPVKSVGRTGEKKYPKHIIKRKARYSKKRSNRTDDPFYVHRRRRPVIQ
jgi:hypothetical protein